MNNLTVNEIYNDCGKSLELILNGKQILIQPFDQINFNVIAEKHFLGQSELVTIPQILIKDTSFRGDLIDAG